MGLDISVWLSVAWLVFLGFALDTHTYRALFVFKIAPFAIGASLLVFWAVERGFIINTGG